ncbi:hypothetical protein BLOT_005272, partial [Blomia tropicalis]
TPSTNGDLSRSTCRPHGPQLNIDADSFKIYNLLIPLPVLTFSYYLMYRNLKVRSCCIYYYGKKISDDKLYFVWLVHHSVVVCIFRPFRIEIDSTHFCHLVTYLIRFYRIYAPIRVYCTNQLDTTFC